jgi:hypothetical protein
MCVRGKHRGLYYDLKIIFIPPPPLFHIMSFFDSYRVPFCLNSSVFCIYFTLLLFIFSFSFSRSSFFLPLSSFVSYFSPLFRFPLSYFSPQMTSGIYLCISKGDGREKLALGLIFGNLVITLENLNYRPSCCFAL